MRFPLAFMKSLDSAEKKVYDRLTVGLKVLRPTQAGES